MDEITLIFTSYPNTFVIETERLEAFKQTKSHQPIHILNIKSKRLMAIIPAEAVPALLESGTLKHPRMTVKELHDANATFYRFVIPKQYEVKQIPSEI